MGNYSFEITHRDPSDLWQNIHAKKQTQQTVNLFPYSNNTTDYIAGLHAIDKTRHLVQ